MNNLNWIKELKKNTESFLGQISEDNFSHIKYSLSGDIYDSRKNWGLGQYVFMSKIIYMLDLLKDLENREKEVLILRILNLIMLVLKLKGKAQQCLMQQKNLILMSLEVVL